MKKTLLAILIFMTFTSTVYAQGSSEQIISDTDFSEIEQFLESNYSALDFRKLIGDVMKGDGPDFSVLTEQLRNSFAGEVRYALALMIKIILVCILLSFLKSFESCAGSVGGAVFFAGCLIVSFILADVFIVAVNTARGSLENINSFVSMSMPLLTVFMAGCGAAKTAACMSPVILLGIEIVSVLIKTLFIPLIFAVGVLALFGFESGGFDMKTLSRSIKSVLKWSMGLTFTLFGGVVSVYGSFSSSVDALSFRAAKYVVGSAVPVVGSLISESMGAFTYSCAVVKNAFGTVVIFVLIFIAALPALKLFLISFMLNITAVLTAGISDKRIVSIISEMSGVISYILALVCLVAFLFIICIAIIIHTANNVVI